MKKKARIRDNRDALRKIKKIKRFIAIATNATQGISRTLQPILNPNLREHRQIREKYEEIDLDIAVNLAHIMVAINELEEFLGE